MNNSLWFLVGIPAFIWFCKKVTEGNEDFNNEDVGKIFLVTKAKQDTIKVQYLKEKPIWYNKPETNNNITENSKYVVKTSNNKLYLEEVL